MGLSAVLIPFREFEVQGEKIVVTGLTLTHLTRIFANAGTEMRGFFSKLQGDKVTIEDTVKGILALVSDFPILAAHGIANAANEPDAWEIAAMLPAAVQIEILEAVADMTFSVQGGPKKTWETVIRILKSLGMASPSELVKNGSGTSEDK